MPGAAPPACRARAFARSLLAPSRRLWVMAVAALAAAYAAGLNDSWAIKPDSGFYPALGRSLAEGRRHHARLGGLAAGDLEHPRRKVDARDLETPPPQRNQRPPRAAAQVQKPARLREPSLEHLEVVRQQRA